MEESPDSVPPWMKITLVFLAAFLLFLGTVVYLTLYGVPGSYTITPISQMAGMSGNSSGSLIVLPSSPTSSTITENASSSTSPDIASTGSYGSVFPTPPVSWTDSGATYAITAASLQNNKLTFTLEIQTGNAPTCVPLDLRLVADESGNLQGPDTLGFAFPDSGNCNDAPNTTYQNQNVTFTVDSTNFPLLFTSNSGSNNIFFEIATTTDNGIRVDLPGTAG